jgi:DNA-binding LacI/PurR family transcriptional regulator
MPPLRILTAAEQVTRHLRDELAVGRWSRMMPGAGRLAAELGVGRHVVEAALEHLEAEGLLIGQGGRRGRRIAAIASPESRSLRVQILLYEDSDAREDFMVDLRDQLQLAGHTAGFSRSTLMDLGMDVGRVARHVEGTEADAWVVRSGPRPVLEWFAGRPTPSFAMFGRHKDVAMAGLTTCKSEALAAALRQLATFGHRRIVMMAREERRKPYPGFLERQFLEELGALGIPTGRYNLPEWENRRRSFHQCLDALFRHTPPTALILGEPALFFAAQQFLAREGLAAPRDVSLLVLESHPAFAWFEPEVSHIRSDTRQWVRRVVRWANHVAGGSDDRRETLTPADLVEGGTIGAAPAGQR